MSQHHGPVRLELTLQFDPQHPEELPQVALELEAQMAPHQWKALLALSRAVVAQEDHLAVHSAAILTSLG
jgi:hypothetical protein